MGFEFKINDVDLQNNDAYGGIGSVNANYGFDYGSIFAPQNISYPYGVINNVTNYAPFESLQLAPFGTPDMFNSNKKNLTSFDQLTLDGLNRPSRKRRNNGNLWQMLKKAGIGKIKITRTRIFSGNPDETGASQTPDNKRQINVNNLKNIFATSNANNDQNQAAAAVNFDQRAVDLKTRNGDNIRVSRTTGQLRQLSLIS